MKATSPRRQLIVAVLLTLATAGAALRHWAPDPSTLRDVGTLLLVMWLPAVGNIVAFAVGRYRQAAYARRHFAPERVFAGHVEVDLVAAPLASSTPALVPLQTVCTLVLGTEGFTARLAMPVALWLTSGQPVATELEFLRPALGLPRFGVGTSFTVLAGSAVLGQGHVRRVLA